MEALNVLYCDEAVLVCEKPTGCLSEPGPGRNLPQLAELWLRERGETGPLHTVHRLDKAVGGLTVLARTRAAAASLIGQIAAGTVEKEYLAVLRGVPAEPEAVLEDLLFHDSRTNKTFVVSRPRKGVREAKLSYRVLARAGTEAAPLTLVRVRLYTGRTHQIRAQFSHRKQNWGTGLPRERIFCISSNRTFHSSQYRTALVTSSISTSTPASANIERSRRISQRS